MNLTLLNIIYNKDYKKLKYFLEFYSTKNAEGDNFRES